MASQAAVVTVPTGLNPGDQYRLVFVTSTTRNATSTTIADYNSFVNTAAALNSDLDGISWTAIASTNSVNALTNTSTAGAGTGITIHLLNDTLFAADYTTLWTTNAKPSLNITEQGVIGGTSLVWAGTNPDGTTNSATLGEASARAGKSNVTSGQTQSWWITRANQTNTLEFSIFAMSEVLTVAVPEPSSTALLGLGGLALIFRRRK